MVYQREDPEGRKRQDASCRRRKPYCVDTGIQDEQSVQSDRKDKNIVEIKITEEEKDGRNDQRDDFGRES